MIQIAGLNKAFGARTLFRDVSLRVGARDRVAVVGPNGSGKTTLFEMIVGAEPPDSGTVSVVKDAVLGYLRQETDALRGRTVLEEVLASGAAMSQAGHRLEILTTELSETTDPVERDRLLEEYATLQQRFEALGGYSIEAEAKRILAGLGFRTHDVERRTEALSGGWLMRVALAKLLLASPDVLLLDEPTNHLDVESVAWLEQFLSAYQGAVLLISHDRDFINAMATKIVEIDREQLWSYTGDYAAFVELRTQRIEQLAAAAKQQSKRVEQLEVFINRFRYKNTKAKQVQSKIKFLEKMERIEAAPTEKRRAMGIRFPTPPRAGRIALELKDVAFAYGDAKVYDGLEIAIERGQKVALVGPNGAGKTTLLKLLAGVLTPQHGERTLGHNVALGYFAQHQIEALDDNNRVMEELAREIPPGTNVRPRELLGRFLFSGDTVDKPVGVLSGGERTRLALAKLLVSPFNVLCLDEPTNHLDVQSRDVLEDALTEYEGAMVLITHDRHLIRTVANRIIEVIDGRVRVFQGDYEHYLWRKEKEAEEAPAAEQTPKRSASAQKERRRTEAAERAASRRHRDAVASVEQRLAHEESELRRLEARMADPDFYAQQESVADAVREYDETRKRIAALEDEWTSLAEKPD